MRRAPTQIGEVNPSPAAIVRPPSQAPSALPTLKAAMLALDRSAEVPELAPLVHALNGLYVPR